MYHVPSGTSSASGNSIVNSWYLRPELTNLSFFSVLTFGYPAWICPYNSHQRWAQWYYCWFLIWHYMLNCQNSILSFSKEPIQYSVILVWQTNIIDMYCLTNQYNILLLCDEPIQYIIAYPCCLLVSWMINLSEQT